MSGLYGGSLDILDILKLTIDDQTVNIILVKKKKKNVQRV